MNIERILSWKNKHIIHFRLVLWAAFIACVLCASAFRLYQNHLRKETTACWRREEASVNSFFVSFGMQLAKNRGDDIDQAQKAFNKKKRFHASKEHEDTLLITYSNPSFELVVKHNYKTGKSVIINNDHLFSPVYPAQTGIDYYTNVIRMLLADKDDGIGIILWLMLIITYLLIPIIREKWFAEIVLAFAIITCAASLVDPDNTFTIKGIERNPQIIAGAIILIISVCLVPATRFIDEELRRIYKQIKKRL